MFIGIIEQKKALRVRTIIRLKIISRKILGSIFRTLWGLKIKMIFYNSVHFMVLTLINFYLGVFLQGV